MNLRTEANIKLKTVTCCCILIICFGVRTKPDITSILWFMIISGVFFFKKSAVLKTLLLFGTMEHEEEQFKNPTCRI